MSSAEIQEALAKCQRAKHLTERIQELAVAQQSIDEHRNMRLAISMPGTGANELWLSVEDGDCRHKYMCEQDRRQFETIAKILVGSAISKLEAELETIEVHLP